MNKSKLVISTYDSILNPHYSGGGAKIVHEIAKKCIDTFDIKVLYGYFKGAGDEIIDGVSYIPARTVTFGPKLSQLSYHMSIPYYAKRLEHDIWIESFTPPFSTSMTSLYTDKPVIGVAQMLTSKDMERKYKLPFGVVERLGLKHYSNFIVLSEHTKNEIKRSNRYADIKIIPNGIDQIPEKKAGKGKHILFIGRLEYNQKGLDLLIDAYDKCKNEINADLIIAGAGNHKDEMLLKNDIEKRGLGSRIKMVGRISGKEKDKMFRESICLVLPSRFDTYPLVILEAFSYNLPAVTFDLPELDWIPQNAALKAKVFDTRDLADSVVKLSNNNKMRNKLGANGGKFVLDKTMEKIADQYKSYFMEILERTK